MKHTSALSEGTAGSLLGSASLHSLASYHQPLVRVLRYEMKTIVLILASILSFQSVAVEQCKEMNVSGVAFFSNLSTSESIFGPFSTREYIEDLENRGQNSGWQLSKKGLEIFVADIGGFTFAKISDPKYIVSYKYKVGDRYADANDENEISLFPCTQPSITEQKITLFLTSSGVIKEIIIQDHGL